MILTPAPTAAGRNAGFGVCFFCCEAYVCTRAVTKLVDQEPSLGHVCSLHRCVSGLLRDSGFGASMIKWSEVPREGQRSPLLLKVSEGSRSENP